MHVIVGLGNPGKEYENTRHNLGFRVIEELANRYSPLKFKNKCQAFAAEVNIGAKKNILLMPQTFMNLSGEAVRGILNWYKIKPDHLVVVYDDVDLEIGQLRLRSGGSAGGHHGVESIISNLNTTDFLRVRIGISRPDLVSDVSDYVLQNIPSAEKEALYKAVQKAADAIEAAIKLGFDQAMNQFN